MTELEKRKISDLRKQGLGYTKISKELGISVNTIKSYCRRNSATKAKIDDRHYCKYCGIEVKQNPGRKEKKFCSDICRMKWWNSHLDCVNRKAFATRTCIKCGKDFTVYGSSTKKYCSHKCYVAFRFGGGADTLS